MASIDQEGELDRIYTTDGEIVIDGVVMASGKRTLEPEKRQLGMVFQSHALWPHMTVFDNVAYGLRRAKQPKALVKERVREVLEVVGMSGIEDLLTTSRMESNGLELAAEPVYIDLEVAKIIDHYPAAGMRVHQDGVRASVFAMVDPVRLRQIFRNLLTNAVRYGGTSIAVTVEAIGPAVHVLVADDGPGVPPGESESISLPYRRATNTRRHEGSVGLGLWISRRLARAMGGDLVYRRELDKTVFDLSVPVYLPAPTAPTLVEIA